MEANAVLLGLVLRDAGVPIGAAGAERLCSSMGRLGIAMTKSRADEKGAPREARRLRTITVDLKNWSMTLAVDGE